MVSPPKAQQVLGDDRQAQGCTGRDGRQFAQQDDGRGYRRQCMRVVPARKRGSRRAPPAGSQQRTIAGKAGGRCPSSGRISQ